MTRAEFWYRKIAHFQPNGPAVEIALRGASDEVIRDDGGEPPKLFFADGSWLKLTSTGDNDVYVEWGSS
jgi:hypothetical protein